MNVKKDCKDYGDLFLNADSEYGYLYNKLLDQTFLGKNGKHEKDTGISIYGNPILYSFKYAKEKSLKCLRTVMEPGGNRISVAKQIDFCLAFLNDVIGELDWQAAYDLNRILDAVYPKDPNETKNWISGMWLGLDTGDEPAMLKVYLNLRHQNEDLRWQKLANLLGLYANKEFEETYRYLAKSIYGIGNPVGLGCAIGKNGLMGIRIYLSFHGINKACVREVCTRFYPNQFEPVDHFIETFLSMFDGIPSSVLNFDFIMGKEGVLETEPIRIKTEISSCNLDMKMQETLPLLIKEQMGYMGLKYSDFKEDVAFAKLYFQTIFYQYLSVGIGKKGEHFTTYFEPITSDGFI